MTGAGGLIAQFYTDRKFQFSCNPHDNQSYGKTHPANHLATPSALADQVSGAVTGFPVVAAAVLHVEPVASACSVAKRLGGINGDTLIAAAEGGREEDAAVLDEAIVDLSAGTGEGVECVLIY